MSSTLQCTSQPSTVTTPQSCVFKLGAPFYVSYDFTPLSTTYQQCTSSLTAFTYSLQFCGSLPASLATGPCESQPPPSSVASLSPGTCFQSYGSSAQVTVTPMESDEGVVVVYKGQGACAGGNPGDTYYTQVALRCDPSLAKGVVVYDTIHPSVPSGCGTLYTGTSSVGCSTPAPMVVYSLGIVASVLTALGLLITLYFVGGTLWNRRVKGALGLEAVPHIRVFRGCY